MLGFNVCFPKTGCAWAYLPSPPPPHPKGACHPLRRRPLTQGCCHQVQNETEMVRYAKEPTGKKKKDQSNSVHAVAALGGLEVQDNDPLTRGILVTRCLWGEGSHQPSQPPGSGSDSVDRKRGSSLFRHCCHQARGAAGSPISPSEAARFLRLSFTKKPPSHLIGVILLSGSVALASFHLKLTTFTVTRTQSSVLRRHHSCTCAATVM